MWTASEGAAGHLEVLRDGESAYVHTDCGRQDWLSVQHGKDVGRRVPGHGNDAAGRCARSGAARECRSGTARGVRGRPEKRLHYGA